MADLGNVPGQVKPAPQRFSSTIPGALVFSSDMSREMPKPRPPAGTTAHVFISK